jgi:hypothetical protein
MAAIMIVKDKRDAKEDTECEDKEHDSRDKDGQEDGLIAHRVKPVIISKKGKEEKNAECCCNNECCN